MKRYHLLRCLSVALLGSWLPAIAADEPAVVQQTVTQAAPAVQTPRLTYGVDEIVKLSRAQISEDVIGTYIQSSGTVYNLHPNDIVQLHNQGVSDNIINLMLTQGHVVSEPTNQPAPVMQVLPIAPVIATPPAAQPAATDQPLFVPGQNAAEIAAAGAPVVEEAPSTLYVIPYSGGYYRSAYTVFGSCFPAYVPSYTVRLGGHRHFYSHWHR
jgi:hypothetical protein